MTDSLYRKEAMEARGHSLLGEVILHSPPSRWLIILLLIAVLGLIAAGLFGLKIGVNELPLWDWVITQFSAT